MRKASLLVGLSDRIEGGSCEDDDGVEGIDSCDCVIVGVVDCSSIPNRLVSMAIVRCSSAIEGSIGGGPGCVGNAHGPGGGIVELG